MSRRKQLLIMILGAAISSQLYATMFVEGFIVAMSPILLVICLYLFKELNPIIGGFAVAFFSPSFRILILMLRGNSFSEAIHLGSPDILFFIVYSILYYFLYYRTAGTASTAMAYTRFFLSIFFCDFFSNFCEMSVRLKGPLSQGMLQGIIAIAAIRTAIILIFVISIDSYRSFLAKQDHEDRYKHLVITSSALSSELYFMQKNMIEIEDVMKKAFSLHRLMDGGDYPEPVRNMSLDIAKDVHEIKKDYVRVMQGLHEVFMDDGGTEGMQIKDLLRIIDMDISEQLQKQRLNIVFSWRTQEDFHVNDHFSLMSILRNLVINSMEALTGSKNGKIELNIVNSEDSYVFTVQDNGPGINEEDLGILFDAGFSTKFNAESGDLYRGMGLSIVKDLTETRFGGGVTVSSAAETAFTVTIPKAAMSGGAL